MMDVERDYISRPETEEVLSNLSSNEPHVHIHGVPLTLKEDIIRELQQYGRWDFEELHVRRGWDIEYLLKKMVIRLEEYRSGTDRVLDRIRSISASLGATPGLSAGVELDLNDEVLLQTQRLETLSAKYNAEKDLIFVIHDVDLLNEDPEVIADRVSEIVGCLDDSIQLLSLGSRKLPGPDNIEVGPLPKETAGDWIQEQFPDLSRSDAMKLAGKTGSYPLALHSLSKTHNEPDKLDVESVSNDIKEQIERFINERFTSEERDILRKASCLVEVDEIATSELTECSPAKAAMLLSSFEQRLVLKNLGRREGISRFGIRDWFHEYFYERCTVSEDIHRTMFQKYARQIISSAEDGEIISEFLAPSTLCTVHLLGIYDDPSPEDLIAEIERMDLDLTQRLAFATAGIPAVAGHIESVERAQYLEFDRIRELGSENSDFNQEILDSLDLSRAMLRFIVAHFSDEAESEIEEGTKIAESCLKTLADREVEDEEIREGFDNPVQQLIALLKSSDEISENLGTLTLGGCILSAYGNKRMGRDYSEYQTIYYVLLREADIDREVADAVWNRTNSFISEVGIKEDLKSALERNIGQLMDVTKNNPSPKASLIEAQGQVDNRLVLSMLEVYFKIYNKSEVVTRFVDDIAELLLVSDDMIPTVSFLYSATGALGLYRPFRRQMVRIRGDIENPKTDRDNQPEK